MNEAIKNKSLNLVMKVELSHKDAHWKANAKTKLYNFDAKCKGCAVCKEGCPILLSILLMFKDVESQV